MLPLAVVLAVLIFYPLILVVSNSLQDKHLGLADAPFIGLTNYTTLLGSDRFWTAASHSLMWTVVSVILQVILGFMLALLLNQHLYGKAFFRGLFLLPWVIPGVVVALIWKWMLNDLYGVVNYYLGKIDPAWSGLAWFSDQRLAMPTVIAVNIWRGAPFVMVILLAGLQTVPRELKEAASMDGANRVQQFWHITIPHMQKLLLIVALVFLLFNFNNFDLIYLMTQGGPSDRTMTLPVLTYELGFRGMDVGASSAVAVIMLVVLAVVSLAYLKWFSAKYAAEG
jgi:multiple sugar transport system permease protein